MPQTVDQFAKSLIAAGLATADEIKALWGTIPAGQRPKDGETFSKLLVARQKLTEFQAQELLSNSPTPLVLGDYVLLSKIGAGGMGQVFKAQHRVMERLVAIKLLPPALVKDEEAVKRFQREVKAAAKLTHPNIVAALDARKERGVWCLVMEYVEGRDLARVVAQDGPLPVTRAVDYIRQAARGLAYAHKSGVVHRDIKPANLLLDKEGTVKILDMGLARIDDAAVAAAQEGLTQSGQVMGTIDYMAPEQAFNTRTADARADIYSLGCTLWRFLTGQNLFAGETVVEKLMAHQTLPIPSLTAVRPDVPAALQQVFERMVAKKPDERWQTMAEVEAALAGLEGPAPSGATQPKPEVDSQLNAFFQSLPGKKPATTPTKTATAAPPDGPAATVSLNSPQVTTDPVSERTIHSAREATRRPSGARPKDKLPLYLVGGLAGVLAVCLGIWVALRGRDGSEVTLPKRASASAGTSSGKSPPGESAGVKPVGPAPPLAVAPFDEAKANQHQQAWAKYLGEPIEKEIALPGGEKLVMVLIPPGEFTRSEDGQARLRVRLTNPFYLGKYEVTQAQWQVVTGSNPSQFKDRPTHPVEMVSWEDTQSFLAKLNNGGTAGPWRFDLPTEAQWEYACRAGTTTAFSFGDSDTDLPQYAWFKENAGDKSHPVGQLQANPFGLYDMHGNVWEWCVDWIDAGYYAKAPLDDPPGPSRGSRRVARGGSWDYVAPDCRTAYRVADAPMGRWFSGGFRLALSPSGVPPEAGSGKSK